MPADYVACRDSYVKKGVSMKTAKARCAAWFYKKHGYTVNEAHKKGKTKGEAPFPPELEGETDIDFDLVELMLKELEAIEAIKPIERGENFAHGDLDVQAVNTEFIDDFDSVEIIATKVGAMAYTSDGRAVKWTKKALSKAADSWKMGNVSVNHNGMFYGKILSSFMDNDLLRMVVKVNAQLKDWLKKFGKNVGVSIEASDTKISKTLNIMEAKGTGVTFVFPPDTPACTQEEGCGIAGTEKISEDEVFSFVPPEAGELPEKGKKILKDVYDKCRKEQFKGESPEAKERCSRIAWTAVKNAGYERSKDGKWTEGTDKKEELIAIENKDGIDGKEIIENKECECKGDEEEVISETVGSVTTGTWTLNNDNTTAGIGTYTIVVPPVNIVEDIKENLNAEAEKVETEGTQMQVGEKMADEKPKEEPKPETICAKKHEAIVKEKDSQIEALNKEMETMKATIAKFEDEKRSALIENLKKEGLESETYKTESLPFLEKILATAVAVRKKIEEAPEVNSGAEVKATEQKTEPEGNALSKTMEEAKAKVDEQLEKSWERAEKEYRLKRPKQ